MSLIRDSKTFAIDFFNRALGRVTVDDKLFAKDFFEEKKRETIFRIRNHPISRELVSHISPSIVLGTSGSLYGFAGFPKGSKPVDEIIKIVEEKMKYTVTKKLFKGFSINITFPDKKDFRVPALVLPWSGGLSFPEQVENGLPGLSNYIKYSGPNSRSREGLQARNPVRAKNMPPLIYLSYIFAVVRNARYNSFDFYKS